MATVVAQPYSTAGNGGRKLVRTNDGSLFAVTKSSTWFYIYKSSDNGSGWILATNGSDTSLQDVSLAPIGNGFGLLAGVVNSIIRFYRYSNNGDYLGQYTIDTNQTAIGNISLAIDPTNGHLYAVWKSKHPTLPDSFNLRYTKSTDDGATWSAVKQLTTANLPNANYGGVSIVVRNGNPVIISDFNNSSTNERFICSYYSTNGGTSFNTSMNIIYNGGTYAQSSPSAVVDKDGVIHVAWYGMNSSNYYVIFYAKSVDGGLTWTSPRQVSVIDNRYDYYPSITVDKDNKLVIMYHDSISGQFRIWQTYSTDIGNTWASPTTLIGSGNNQSVSALFDPYFNIKFGSTPPTIYQTGTSVEYIGTYTTNQAPTVTLNTPDNQTLSASAGQNELLVEGFTVDSDPNNTVTVKLQINDGTIRNIHSGVSDGYTPINFSKLLTYYDKVIYDGGTPISTTLAEGIDHKLKVWAEDGNGGTSVIAERKFRVIHNRPPVITGTDEDLGTVIETPSIVYQVNDLEANAITITEKINGQVIRTFEAEPDTDYTLEIPLEQWILLQLETHTLTIEATDSAGLTSVRTYTFTRTEDTIQLELKNPFETDIASTRILVTPEVYIPIGATILIEACNNAFDEVPTWEDITSMAMAKRGYNFTNTTKTADKWGINIRFTLEKGTATQEVRLDGFGGAFE